MMAAPVAKKVESSEPRHLEFELRPANDARGPTEIPVYAVYYVCEEKGGQCLYLRQDLTVQVVIGE